MTFAISALSSEISTLLRSRGLSIYMITSRLWQSAEFTTEKRAGKDDNQYLAIGIATVSRLYLLDQTSSYNYLHLDATFNIVLKDFLEVWPPGSRSPAHSSNSS